MADNRIVVICGPTASGKSALAVALAHETGGEVVGADSMQVYRRMDIGTAKPTAEEMEGVPHHMIDVADPEENYSVARYVQDGCAAVDDILARGKLPIVAGGTGLYIDNLVAGRSFAPLPEEGAIRRELQRRARAEGLPVLLEELRRVDPEAAARFHPNDEKRIIRALEVYLATGQTITSHNEATRALPPRYRAVTVALGFADRGQLKARIDRRVDEMMERGLEGEVRALLQSGVEPGCTAMQAIGYKELTGAILGDRPIGEAAAEVKLRTRQYAKRQLTWFRRSGAANWFLWDDEPDFSKALAFSTNLVRGSGVQ